MNAYIQNLLFFDFEVSVKSVKCRTWLLATTLILCCSCIRHGTYFYLCYKRWGPKRWGPLSVLRNVLMSFAFGVFIMGVYGRTFYVYNSMSSGSTVSSVGRVPDSRSQGRGIESHQGRGVVSFSKTLNLHCLVLETSRHD